MNTQIKVGEEVVLMNVYISGPLAPGGVPIQHNSPNSPGHPCRGRVLKIGRKWLHVQTIGAPWKVRPYQADTEGLFGIPVKEAKRLYRLAMETRGSSRGQAFIDQCVKEL